MGCTLSHHGRGPKITLVTKGYDYRGVTRTSWFQTVMTPGLPIGIDALGIVAQATRQGSYEQMAEGQPRLLELLLAWRWVLRCFTTENPVRSFVLRHILCLFQNCAKKRTRRKAPHSHAECGGCLCLFMKYFRVYTDALCRILPIAVLFAIAFSGPVYADNPSGKVVFTLDFQIKQTAMPSHGLKRTGFQFKLDANDLSPDFSHKRLVLETNTEACPPGGDRGMG